MRKGLPALILGLALAAGSSPILAAAPLPRIAIRSGSPAAQFYNVVTGARFTPDGFSYTILNQIAYKARNPNAATWAHVTLDPGFYDPAAIDAALTAIAGDDFNVVRIIVDSGDSVHQSRGQYGIAGPPDSEGLYKPVVDNLLDFLRRAREHRVYVIVTMHAWPENRGFKNIVQAGTLPHVTGTSQYYFAPGGIRAKAEYAKELVSDVASADGGSLLSTVLAWELQVEIFVSDETEPFSLHSGTVRTADGKSYDMGDPTSRQACMDSNTIHWANEVSSAIHSVDPRALVTAGFTTFNSVHKLAPNGLIRTPGSDQRYPPRPLPFIRAHALSFIDIHAYPKRDPNYSLERDLDSNEFAQWDMREVPVVLGEYGSNKRQFPVLQTAVEASRRQQSDALRLGIAGAVYWTWDSIHEEWWSATDAGGAIAQALLRPK